MIASYRKIISGVVLGAVAILVVLRMLPPPALPADAPEEVFSAGRAIGTIKAIASSPRLVGSPAYQAAEAYLLAQMAALGFETQVQETTLDGVRVENVLGRLEGSASSDAILLSAHLDTVENSPGATDNASGVAVVLETVRALQAVHPLHNTLVVLFTGPEEDCCIGASAFVSQHPWAKDVRLVVNVDAGGLTGPSFLAAAGPDAGWLVEQAALVIPNPIASSAIEALANPGTDYARMFRPAGWIGYDFNLSWGKRIHSPLDNVAELNPASIQHQGQNMLAVVRHFANLPLEIPRTPRPVYFDILRLGIVYYPASWAVYILLGVSLIFAVTIALGFQRKCLSFRGMGYGVMALLLSLLTVLLLLALVQYALIQPLLPANPQLGPALEGDNLLSNGIRWGSMILTLASTVSWYTLLRKNKQVTQYDLAFGACLLLYVCAIGTTLALLELSYLFAWPLLASSIAAIFWFPSNQEKIPYLEGAQSIGILAAGIIALVLFVPNILMAIMSIDISMIYFVPASVVVLLGFLFPVFDIFD